MRLVAALEYEKLRDDVTSKNKILLNKDGSFYHIYDWSAWLVCTICCAGENAPVPKVFKYTGKDKEYVMLGFPLASLSKYIPQYKSVNSLEGDDLLIEIDLPDGENIDADALQASYEEWRSQVPVSEGKKAKSQKEVTSGNGQTPELGRSGLFHIVSQILSYPVEASTPAQNIEFISKLRQQVAAVL